MPRLATRTLIGAFVVAGLTALSSPAYASLPADVAPDSPAAPTVEAPVELDALAAGGWSRLAGTDRFATAVAVSREYSSGVPVVYVASGENFPDALSAAPAAALQGGPLLLTARDSLPTIVRQAIEDLAPSLIVVPGGTASVSEAVYNELATLAPAIRRDAGADRFATSRAVNTAAFADGADTAFIAAASNFPDALSASAVAGGTGSPVLLVNGGAPSIDSQTLALIDQLGVTSITIAGGTAVVSSGIQNQLSNAVGSSNVRRLAGDDRYRTSQAVNRGSFDASPTVYLASGNGFADALAGAALAGRHHAALYVIPGTCVPDYDIADMRSLGMTKHVLLGGPVSLSSAVESLTPCAAPPAPPTPPTPPAPPANPGDTKNCGDFATWREAQEWFDRYYPLYGDVAKLDQDNDRIACETLPGHL
ncbi:cell wall-binding repeat-containing protein [Compostimonas suwonensis]|uniref:Excalibur calcium-binding domain-containing protein n=1 Tax=Compostimonas suwonensis TaxID=1048394 RepID=A0A2M9BWD9_9MICO|nr:cell wall-binding repeat-containing protein [Compostimonas suwonensis]PJJ62234.1 excalibur calcium-binding domain-containing protein [Compostimonas suwonensis]